MVHGTWARTFWGLVVGCGLGVPLVTLVGFRRSKPAVIVGALAALIGAGAIRFLFLAIH
jgi:formate-dependent nitrite reductase membrane component NrfD